PRGGIRASRQIVRLDPGRCREISEAAAGPRGAWYRSYRPYEHPARALDLSPPGGGDALSGPGGGDTTEGLGLHVLAFSQRPRSLVLRSGLLFSFRDVQPVAEIVMGARIRRVDGDGVAPERFRVAPSRALPPRACSQAG